MGYLGSKMANGAYQTIISLMPPHRTYVELFLGMGAVVKQKPRAEKSIGVEINPKVVEEVRKQPEMEGVEVIEMDVFKFLSEFQPNEETLIYADPPYLHEVRTSAKRYEYELTEEDHRRLLGELKKQRAMVMISGYPSKVYDEELQGWSTVEFRVMTRGGARTEKVWKNFGGEEVQWATFAGRNFTDRQRIKRKAKRWANDYKALDAGERLAILAEIMKVHEKRP